MMFRISIYSTCIAILFLLANCSRYPEGVQRTLEEAEDNREELEKVLACYEASGDSLKLRAAFFLIENMRGKYSNLWKNRGDYETLYSFIKAGNSNDAVKTKWDSLKEIHDVSVEEILDSKSVKSEILIRNIDLAFQAWRGMPWGKHYNFDEFCEYILPYKVNHEPVDNWRPFLLENMKWFLDSLQDKKDVKQACKFIIDYVDKHHRILSSLNDVPKLGTVDAFHHPAGICEHRFILIIDILRTFGIPCAMDFTPQYTNWAGGHPWLVLIDSAGKSISFPGGERLRYPKTNEMPIGFADWETKKIRAFKWQATKIYRYTYKNTEDQMLKSIFSESCVDITHEYDMHMGKIGFRINKENGTPIYLCAFGQKSNIAVVAYSKTQSDSVYFDNVGLNTFYFPSTISNGKIIPLQNPIFFDTLGMRRIYTPSTVYQVAKLTRKYPDDGTMTRFGEHILGSKIEASNSSSFKKCVTLHQVDSIPYHFVEVNISNLQPFRYVRLTAPDSGYLRFVELEYYSNEGKLNGKISGRTPEKDISAETLQKIADGSVSTALNAPGKSWVMIDFEKPYQVKKIKYVQRSRINYVEIGNTYKLFYFDMGWKSLGTRVATESYLTYEVPLNSVLLLRNMVQGKEERIFTYENGRQHFK